MVDGARAQGTNPEELNERSSTMFTSDDREFTSTKERYGVYMERKALREYKDAVAKGAVTRSTADGKIKTAPPTGTDWRTRRMQPTSGGWVAGEREKYEAAQDDNVNVYVDMRSEATREADHERDLITTRAWTIWAKWNMKIAMAETPKDKRKLASQREWIIEQLRKEWLEVEERPLGCDEVLALQEALEHEEEQALSEIREQARRHSSTEELKHQAHCEAEMMRADAKVAWIAERDKENRAMLKTELDRYYKQFGPGEWSMESLFPMWEDTDKGWKLVPKKLISVWNAELRKREMPYKAAWTMAKMVNSRYEAQLKYKSAQAKKAYNKAAENKRAAEAGQEASDWFDAVVAR